jgi:hypothetical protein
MKEEIVVVDGRGNLEDMDNEQRGGCDPGQHFFACSGPPDGPSSGQFCADVPLNRHIL